MPILQNMDYNCHISSALFRLLIIISSRKVKFQVYRLLPHTNICSFSAVFLMYNDKILTENEFLILLTCSRTLSYTKT